MNYQWLANTGSLATGVCTEEDAARKRIRNSKWCSLIMSIGFTRELTQSLSLLRLHVTIYSTNVDDDDMWESGSPRSGSGEAGVLAATIGSSPVAIATVVTSRFFQRRRH